MKSNTYTPTVNRFALFLYLYFLKFPRWFRVFTINDLGESSTLYLNSKLSDLDSCTPCDIRQIKFKLGTIDTVFSPQNDSSSWYKINQSVNRIIRYSVGPGSSLPTCRTLTIASTSNFLRGLRRSLEDLLRYWKYGSAYAPPHDLPPSFTFVAVRFTSLSAVSIWARFLCVFSMFLKRSRSSWYLHIRCIGLINMLSRFRPWSSPRRCGLVQVPKVFFVQTTKRTPQTFHSISSSYESPSTLRDSWYNTPCTHTFLGVLVKDITNDTRKKLRFLFFNFT